MAGTALAVYKPKQFMALGGTVPDDVRDAMASLDDVGESFGAEDIQRITCPAGGGLKWQDGDDLVPSIDGILVGIVKRAILWPSEEAKEGSQPVLTSYDRDLKIGTLFVDDEHIPANMVDVIQKHRIGDTNQVDISEAGGFPYAKFGSGKEGSGKRLREQRMLFILREGDLFPVLVTISPASIRNVTLAIKQGCLKHKIAYWRAVVSLTLEKAQSKGGHAFGKVNASIVGQISAEDGMDVKEKFTDKLTAVAETIDVTEDDADE